MTRWAVPLLISIVAAACAACTDEVSPRAVPAGAESALEMLIRNPGATIHSDSELCFTRTEVRELLEAVESSPDVRPLTPSEQKVLDKLIETDYPETCP